MTSRVCREATCLAPLLCSVFGNCGYRDNLSRGWINLYIVIGVQVGLLLFKHWFVAVRTYFSHQPASLLNKATHAKVCTSSGAVQVLRLHASGNGPYAVLRKQ